MTSLSLSPTPVFWPGEFHGPYSQWGCKESDTTERLSLHFTSQQFKEKIPLVFNDFPLTNSLIWPIGSQSRMCLFHLDSLYKTLSVVSNTNIPVHTHISLIYAIRVQLQ